MINRQAYTIEVLDSGGSKCLEQMRPRWIRGSEGLVLVYNISRRSSFEYVRQLYQTNISVLATVGAISIALVGNMNDRSPRRKVSIDEGRALANQWGAFFFEVNIKIVDAGLIFTSLLINMRKFRGEQMQDSRSGFNRENPMLRTWWNSISSWICGLRRKYIGFR